MNSKKKLPSLRKPIQVIQTISIHLRKILAIDLLLPAGFSFGLPVCGGLVIGVVLRIKRRMERSYRQHLLPRHPL